MFKGTLAWDGWTQCTVQVKVPTKGKLIVRFLKLALKGVWHKIYSSKFFSWSSLPQAPEYPVRTVSNFFKKFAEIFANERLSAVSPETRGKILHYKFVSYFIKSLVVYSLHLYIEVLLIFLIANLCWYWQYCLITGVKDNDEKFIGGIVNSFSAVSLTLTITFRLFSYFWHQQHLGKMLSMVSTIVMSTIPKRKHKRSDIEANYRNKTKTFWCVPKKEVKRFCLVQKLWIKIITFWCIPEPFKSKSGCFCVI
jgi:hypothetical protein